MAIGPSSGAAGDANERFRAYLADDWRQWMVEVPEIATVVGFPGQNDRWTDDSPEGIAQRKLHLTTSTARLGEFRAESLGPSERTNFHLYRRLLDLAAIGVGFGDDPMPYHFGWPHSLWMPLNQMDGLHLSAGQLFPIAPRSTVADVEAIVARMKGLPAAVEQNHRLLEEGRRAGMMPSRAGIRGLPDQVASLVPEDPTQSAIFEPFKNLGPGVPDAEQRRLTEEARRAYAEGVRPAFVRLHEYLVRDYVPAARETVGLSALPNGRAMYEHHVRWTTTTELTPEQIHEIGLREVRRVRAEMEALIQSTGFPGSFGEFYRFLRTDVRFHASSAGDLLDRFRVVAKRIDPELAPHFGRLPRLPYGVAAIPDFSAPSSPGAYYQPGAPESGRAGMFYANTYDLPSRQTWRMEALTLHEAVPGHHLQIALAAELENVPEFRKHSGETAFVEGWGLYAESLGSELGLYQDPYSRFGSLDFDMWRSIRLVVDTGMHALGWSRERAIDFFRENTGMADLDVQVEVDRYIVIPGQALAYKIGQLKIRELRTLAERALGPAFDERAFHDVVLLSGAVPLGELEAHVRAWIDRRGRSAEPGR
ncbi:MAG TPA: DUF885 domain-containing protein [Thermoplasmata archaeon]|nr:DUF885 domain-containing protein [Thermoplasmata archaeon]